MGAQESSPATPVAPPDAPPAAPAPDAAPAPPAAPVPTTSSSGGGDVAQPRDKWPSPASVLRNAAEEDGLRRALDAVKKQGNAYKIEGGLSPLSFFLGLMNVGISAFVLGRRPQYYWVYASLKSVAVNYLSYRLKVRAHQRLYLLDLCHVLSFAYSIVTSAALIAWFVPATRATLAPLTSSPAAFRAIFALANGPLGWAVPTLANALVLHSVKQTAALFIHISPPLVTWAMRWHAREHDTVGTSLHTHTHPPRY